MVLNKKVSTRRQYIFRFVWCDNESKDVNESTGECDKESKTLDLQVSVSRQFLR